MQVALIIDHVDYLHKPELTKLVDECLTSSKLNLFPDDLLNELDGNSFDILLLLPIKSVNHLDELLSHIYGTVREVLTRYDQILLPINVLLGNFNKDNVWDTVFSLGDSIIDTINIKYRHKVAIDLPKVDTFYKDSARIVDINENEDRNKFEVTALGGTFDHIHDGHKILLTIGAFLTSERLIVGLTDQQLLVNKKFKDMLQNFQKRRANIESFIQLLKPSLKVEIIPLNDVCGPTGTVPEIESLIVSQETLSGGQIVNKTRQERQMRPLEIVVVNVLGSNGGEHDNWKGKLSSTDIRRILHKRKFMK